MDSLLSDKHKHNITDIAHQYIVLWRVYSLTNTNTTDTDIAHQYIILSVSHTKSMVPHCGEPAL